MPKDIGKTFSNQQLAMRVYMKLVMILELQWKAFPLTKSDCQMYDVPTW
jgi:hypothetical protein